MTRLTSVAFGSRERTPETDIFPPLRIRYNEKFLQPPLLNASIAVTANLNWEIAGTNAADNGVTFDQAGGVVLTTAGANNDQVLLQPHTDTKQSALTGTKFNTSLLPRFEALLTFAPSGTMAAALFHMGLMLTNTATVGTDDNAAFFRLQDTVNSGLPQAIVSSGGTDTTKSLVGPTIEANKTHLLSISLDENRIPIFSINGSLLYTGPALPANIDLIPFIGVAATTGAAKSIAVHELEVSCVRGR
jgi:hypothetical protein